MFSCAVAPFIYSHTRSISSLKKTSSIFNNSCLIFLCVDLIKKCLVDSAIKVLVLPWKPKNLVDLLYIN